MAGCGGGAKRAESGGVRKCAHRARLERGAMVPRASSCLGKWPSRSDCARLLQYASVCVLRCDVVVSSVVPSSSAVRVGRLRDAIDPFNGRMGQPFSLCPTVPSSTPQHCTRTRHCTHTHTRETSHTSCCNSHRSHSLLPPPHAAAMSTDESTTMHAPASAATGVPQENIQVSDTPHSHDE